MPTYTTTTTTDYINYYSPNVTSTVTNATMDRFANYYWTWRYPDEPIYIDYPGTQFTVEWHSTELSGEFTLELDKNTDDDGIEAPQGLLLYLKSFGTEETTEQNED